MAAFSVTSYDIDNACCTSQANFEVTKKFCGIFTEETLPIFIEIEINKMAADEGKTIDNANMMKFLVRHVIENGAMRWNLSDDCSCGRITVIDGPTSKGKWGLLTKIKDIAIIDSLIGYYKDDNPSEDEE